MPYDVGTGGLGKESVHAGDGAGLSVTLEGDGVLEAVVGHGAGASIDLEGAGQHHFDARGNTGATIRSSGRGGGYVTAAKGDDVAVNGTAVTANGVHDGVSVSFF